MRTLDETDDLSETLRETTRTGDVGVEAKLAGDPSNLVLLPTILTVALQRLEVLVHWLLLYLTEGKRYFYSSLISLSAAELRAFTHCLTRELIDG